MAEFIAVEMGPSLLTAAEGDATYWVIDTNVGTNSTTGKVFGNVHSRHVSLVQAINTAEWLNTPTP